VATLRNHGLKQVHSSRASDLLASPLGLQLLDLISMRGIDRLSEDELTELLEDARSSASRFRGDYDDYAAELKGKAPLLTDQAEWLVHRFAHLWSDLDRGRQVWVTTLPEVAEAERVVQDLAPFNLEVSKPKRTFWTCTANDSVYSPWLDWLRFRGDQRPGPYYLWNVVVSASARVFEIHSAASWAELCRAHPSDHQAFRYIPQHSSQIVRPEGSARVDPDWSKVAEEWDGVHLSIGGWLTAEDVPYRSGGVTTELRSWDMESTAWFRWPFTAVERDETLER
jgi:hypothetical protein